MKKVLFVLAVLAFMTGCGSKDKAAIKDKDVSSFSDKQNYMAQGLAHLAKSDMREAIHSFDQAIRQNPRNEKAFLVLGETYMRMKQYDHAIDTFNAATHIAPLNGELYYLLAINHSFSGNVSEARESVQKSILLFERSKNAEGLKKSLVLLKQMDEAAQAVKK